MRSADQMYLDTAFGELRPGPIGAVAGTALLATRRGTRTTAIPFWPYLIVAALVAVFVAQPLADGYLRLFGRA